VVCVAQQQSCLTDRAFLKRRCKFLLSWKALSALRKALSVKRDFLAKATQTDDQLGDDAIAKKNSMLQTERSRRGRGVITRCRTAGVGMRGRSSSLYHSRQCGIVVKPRLDCSRKL